jgi:hypothetical protein
MHPYCIVILLHRRCGAEEYSGILAKVGEEGKISRVNYFATAAV